MPSLNIICISLSYCYGYISDNSPIIFCSYFRLRDLFLFVFFLFVLALFRSTPTTSGPISEVPIPDSPATGTVDTAPTPAADPKETSPPVLEQDPGKDLPTEEKKVLETSEHQTTPQVNGVAAKKIDQSSDRANQNGVEGEKTKGADTTSIPTPAQKEPTPPVTEAVLKTKPDNAATDNQQTTPEADNVRTKKKKVVKSKSKVPSTTAV